MWNTMAANPHPSVVNDRDNYDVKSLVFYGEIFGYWKDRIRSFFLGHDVDIWDMVVVVPLILTTFLS